ncbi:MAG: anion permease [Planctomycetota bacterium]
MIASQAAELTDGAIALTYGTWLLYAARAGALASLLVVPWIIHRWEPPEVQQTPPPPTRNCRACEDGGCPKGMNGFLIVVFLTVCGLWISPRSSTRLWWRWPASGALLLSGVIITEDAITEKSAAWDVFIWYGGLVQLGEHPEVWCRLPSRKRSRDRFSTGIGLRCFGNVGDLLLRHYAFASITAHVLSMLAPFLLIFCLGAGCPPAVAVLAFAYFETSPRLTHYGTTHGPILFSTDTFPSARGARGALPVVREWRAMVDT